MKTRRSTFNEEKDGGRITRSGRPSSSPTKTSVKTKAKKQKKDKEPKMNKISTEMCSKSPTKGGKKTSRSSSTSPVKDAPIPGFIIDTEPELMPHSVDVSNELTDLPQETRGKSTTVEGSPLTGFVVDTEPDIVPDHAESLDEQTQEDSLNKDKDAHSSAVQSDADALDESVSMDTEVLTEKSRPSGKKAFDETKEKELEKFLFGNDLGGGVGSIREPSLSDSESESDADEAPPTKKRKAVWEDEEDEDILVKDHTAQYDRAIGKHGQKETSEEKYSRALKKKFISIVGTPAWADLTKEKSKASEDEDSDEEFFRTATNVLDDNQDGERLSEGYLMHRKLNDLNYETHCEGSVIKAIEFHPTAQVGLVAGINGSASLFQVDGKFNPKMQTINFHNYPIHTAHFSAEGNEFIVGSDNFQHFYTFDMKSGKTEQFNLGRKLGQGFTRRFQVSPTGNFLAFPGKDGYIQLLSARSKERAFKLKMNEGVAAMQFSSDGDYLYSSGATDEVYIWDLRSQACIHRFRDSGTVHATALALSRNMKYIATGSDAGVVNLYEREVAMKERNPAPIKAFMNLVTPVHHLRFNPTSELLVSASEFKENAVKLAHIPSRTVYKNFPGMSFNVKRINCVSFSPNGGFMALGNNRGAANMYRLAHYKKF